jgi:hypothetical protein
VVKAHETQEGQVTPLVVVAVEKDQLLLSVRRIVRLVKIDRYYPGPSAQTTAMTLDDPLRQLIAHPEQIRTTRPVLESTQRRLRGQLVLTQRRLPHQEFVHRIRRQPRRVVTVRIPARNAVNPLPHKGRDLVNHPGRITVVPDAARQRLAQPKPAIGRSQQNRPAVRTTSFLVELNCDRALRQILEQPTLCRAPRWTP